MRDPVFMVLLGLTCAFAGWAVMYASARWENERREAHEALLARGYLTTGTTRR